MPHDERQQGIKKSDFVEFSTIPAGSTFDFVINGTNIKIKKENLLAELGVTGTIVTAGAATATDILQPVGSVNRIRGIEDGPGIFSELSPQNGITLKHNFVQDTVGVPVAINLTDATPDFVSLLPGNGIQIIRTDGVVTITATGIAAPATKTIFINQLSDFPAAVAGVITLQPEIIYIISNDISTSNRFVLSGKTSVIGHSLLGATLTYTGSGTMFTGIDVTSAFLNLHLDCPSAKLFDFSDTVGGVQGVSMTKVRVESCDTVGDFDAMQAVIMDDFLVLSIATRGILYSGTGTLLILIEGANFITASATFVGVDFGNCVAESIMVETAVFIGPPGSIGITGAASNANLTATGLGQIRGNTFTGGMTPVSVLDLQQDVQWLADRNAQIQDTKADSLSTNAGGTVTIATIDTPVKIAGTWVEDNSAHFTVDGTGTVTYIGIKPLQVPLSAMVSADPVSGSNKDFTIYFAIDGVVDTASGVPGRASSGDKRVINAPWQHTFLTGETVEVHLENNTDAVNFNLRKAILRID